MDRRYRRRGKNGGSPGWMVTYSDLMSLLLTFFVLLYSMSTLDAEKFKEISRSLQTILSGIGGPEILEGYKSEDPISSIVDIENNTDEAIDRTSISDGLLFMYDRVMDYVSEKGLDAKVSVSMNKRGVFVDIKEAILFESGSAELKDGGIEVLKKLEGLINDFNNDIVIEGHTDNVPINNALYPSNWELSTARAVKVLRYLSEVARVEPERLSAIGYGEYRPIVPNDSDINRANNRRVNILIVFDEESGGANGTN